MKNRIYFFTGTGNSLKVAKDLAASMGNCELIAICKDADLDIPTGYDRIGFVFPVYFFGLPQLVVDFVHKANLTKESAGYFFAVATPGGFSGKPLTQMERLLSKKGIPLAYGNKIRMNANFIVRYGSIGLYHKTAIMGYGRRISKIKEDVKNRKTVEIEQYSKRVEDIYLDSIRDVHNTDAGYHSDGSCTACGICAGVCPAGNITLEKGRPEFHHLCESCMACIQYCPQKAINYEDKTQKRKRYTHPEIRPAELMKYYKPWGKEN